jgi:ankyrin repeat protein
MRRLLSPRPSFLLSVFVSLLLILGGCGAPDRPSISLYTAIKRGDIEQLRRHIHWKTNLDAPLPNGRYPLHEAARAGRVVMLRMLLKQHVRIEPRDHDGRTPLELAILNGRTQAARTLIKAGAHFDPSRLLLLAAQANVTDRDVIRFLRREGADIDVRDAQGNTPLLIAAMHGNHRLIHHLVEYGANVNARNKAGETALSLLRQRHLPEIERFLRENGASQATPPGHDG